MIRPMQFIRMLQIYLVLMRYALTSNVIGQQNWFLKLFSYLNPFSLFNKNRPRGESLCLALEKLGPIFIKFGQLLSTRRDLLPEDIADALTKLQDKVEPFPGKQAISMIEASFGKSINELFAQFSETPLASASIAQVHAATLHDGSDVIVKILRPNVKKFIRRDISLMYLAAKWVERFWSHGKRLHPVELVKEFEQTIIDELDLMREAASASQLRRNFADSSIMYVPKIYWDHTLHNVMVMERIYGIQISDTASLKANNVNMKKLAEYGVEIFFTQVFRDSFFHADMHPGNLFVDATDPENPKYLGVDFGIMGTLSPEDLHYLAGNLFAFFNRDYHRVAELHVQSGWVPPDTRIDQFESAIRTVCEPIFEKPLSEISFGQLLLRLFQTAERFQMEVQPQLMLLQKTLLSIEGLGRQLYPDLDLWTTAKPFMSKWMIKQKGLKAVFDESKKDWQETLINVIKTPHLLHDVLDGISRVQRSASLAPVQQKTSSRSSSKKSFFFGAGLALVAVSAVSIIMHRPADHLLFAWQWTSIGAAAVSLLIGWSFET